MMFVLMILIVVAHQADEDRGEEHKDECLQECDEEFHEGDQDRSPGTDQRDCGDCARRSPPNHEVGTEKQQSREQDMATDHVCKQADGQSNRLDEDTRKFDHKDDRNDQKQELGSLGQAAREVVQPTEDSQLTETVDLNQHETDDRQAECNVDIAGRCATNHRKVIIKGHPEDGRAGEDGADDVLNIGKGNHSQKIHSENEEKQGQEKRQVPLGVLLAHDGFNHHISEVDDDRLDHLTEAAFGDVALIAFGISTSLNLCCGSAQEQEQQNRSQHHGRHLHGEVTNDADIEEFFVKNMPEWGVCLTACCEKEVHREKDSVPSAGNSNAQVSRPIRENHEKGNAPFERTLQTQETNRLPSGLRGILTCLVALHVNDLSTNIKGDQRRLEEENAQEGTRKTDDIKIRRRVSREV